MPNLAKAVKPASKKSNQAAIRYCSQPIRHPRQFDPSGNADTLSKITKTYPNGLRPTDGLSTARGTDLNASIDMGLINGQCYQVGIDCITPKLRLKLRLGWGKSRDE